MEGFQYNPLSDEELAQLRASIESKGTEHIATGAIKVAANWRRWRSTAPPLHSALAYVTDEELPTALLQDRIEVLESGVSAEPHRWDDIVEGVPATAPQRRDRFNRVFIIAGVITLLVWAADHFFYGSVREMRARDAERAVQLERSEEARRQHQIIINAIRVDRDRYRLKAMELEGKVE